jgi:DNA gyrase subunit B
MENNNHYNSDDIVELKYPNNVRRKIGMYLGNSGQKGFNHTFTEIFDNSIDEFVAGNGDKITVTVDSKTNTVSIRDFGRGIPYGKNKEGNSALTLALTVLHAGGKHSNDIRNSSYKYSSGVHGVGASVVQAASNFMNAIVYHDNEKAYQTFENGIPTSEVVIMKRTELIDWEPEDEGGNGTYIVYQPSIKEDEFDKNNVFDSECVFEKEWFIDKLKYTSYMNIGLEVNIDFDGEEIKFEKQKDVKDILKLSNPKFLLEETQVFKEEFALLLSKEAKTKKVVNIQKVLDMDDEEFQKWEMKISEMELVYNFTETADPIQLYFVNGVLVKGGKQEQSLKLQMKRFFNEYVKDTRKNPIFYETEDIFGNFSFMFSVKLNEPKFSGQTKEALDNVEVTTIATAFLKKYFQFWFAREDKKVMDILVKLVDANKKARQASDKIKENVFKEIFSDKEDDILNNKGKLEECRTKDRTRAELFIVEGDSAGGSAKQSKSHEYQALLPLKGKPLNTLKKANQVKIFNNDEIISLVTALETDIGDKYNYEKLRYNKIILMSDADIDGQHINALMLTFFFNFYRELIELGHVYLALSPLYKIVLGKDTKWAWSKEELDEIVKGKSKFQITRNKGLGEMDPEELWETTLNPVNRKLIQVRIEDYEKEKDNIDIYMGDDESAKKVLKDILKQHYDELKDNRIIKLTSPDNMEAN